MAVTGLNHITLTVSDLARSLAFYRTVLGGELCAQWARGAYLELGSLWLCLSVEEVAARRDDSHVALSCTADAFQETASRISRNALKWKDDVSEGASLYFLDPDGHKLELHVGDLHSRLAHYRAHPEKSVTLFD